MNKLLSQLKKLKATEADGWDHAMKNKCCPGDDWADGYNHAVKDIIKIIRHTDELSTKRRQLKVRSGGYKI